MKFTSKLFLLVFISSVVFPSVARADDTWWNASWQKRLKITISNGSRAENLVNFPVMVALNSSRISYGDFLAGGDDVRFVDADGSTVLDYEIEKWNTSATSTMWVRVPQIDASSNTDYIYLYYDNSGASAGANPTGVWDSNYLSVLHLGNNPSGSGPQEDSSSNNRDATSISLTSTSTGVIGDGLDLNGTTQYVQYASTTLPAPLNAGTVEIMYNPDTFASDANGRYLFTKDKSGTYMGEWRLMLGSEAAVPAQNNKLAFRIECPTSLGGNGNAWAVVSSVAPSLAGGWYGAGAVWDKNGGAGNMKLYWNGTATGTPYLNTTAVATADPTCAMEVTGEKPEIGRNNGKATPDGYFDGQVDEFRISNVVRSASWLSASYDSNIDNLLTYGSNDSAPGTPGSVVATGYDSKVNVKWTTSSGTVTDYFVEYKLSSDSTWTAFSDAVSTATSTLVTGLTNNLSYDFRVAASNNGLRSATSSTVTVTPESVISFISPTISNSSATTSTSITAYASTTLSNVDYVTFRLETSGGSLISHATTSTKYGDYNLDHLATTTNKANLSITSDLSGIAYVPTTNTLFTIHNNQNVIHEIALDGTNIRTITCSSCNDAEDITLVSSVASSTVGGYDHTFLISTEDGSTTSHQVFQVIIHSTGSVTVNRTNYYSTSISSSPATNNGLEGVAYNSNTGHFYAALEGQELSDNSPGIPKIYEVTPGNISTHSASSAQICTNIDWASEMITNSSEFPASPGRSDISGLYFEPTNNHLYVLSHMADKLVEVDITDTSDCSILREKRVFTRADSGANYKYEMPEGITWDNTGGALYLGTEADYLSVWQTTSYNMRNTFSGLSDGNYNLYTSVTDSDGITSTSSARSFTITSDVTAPTISSVNSDKTNGSYKAGEVIDIDVTFSEAVTSTGSVTVTLETGDTDRTCTFTVSNSTTGTCNYTVQAGDASSDLTVSSISGTIADQASNAMSNFVPVTNLAANKALVIDTSNPVISGVASSSVSYSGATITWTTDENATSTVNYGTTASYGTSSSSAVSTTNHSIVLSGLSGSTTYHFQVASGDTAYNYATSTDYTFTTTEAPDTTPPVISSIASSTTETTATITWTTNESATSTVNFGATLGYGTASSSSSLTTSHSITLSSLTPSTTYHFQVSSGDASYNYATSTDLTFTTAADTGVPSISSISSGTPTSSGATITWSTDEDSSSKVIYGPSTSYSGTTAESDTSTRVSSHSVSLSGLVSCTLYHYKVVSRDSSLNSATSTDNTFTTTGCTGSASIGSTQTEDITVGAGGSLSLVSGLNQLDLTIPVDVSSTTSSLAFQAKVITDTSVVASAGKPTGKTLADNQIYDIKAYSDAVTIETSFDDSITITLTYSDSDVSGIDESTLRIYRYDGFAWEELSNCSVNTSANTITCTTDHFSVFGLFGDASASSSSSSSSVSSSSGTSDASIRAFLIEQILLIQKELERRLGQTVTSDINLPTIKAQLKLGSVGPEVLILQKKLNQSPDTEVASTGLGSKGNETDRFGALTKEAVIKFQLKYNIISSRNDPFAGVVGPNTRGRLNGI